MKQRAAWLSALAVLLAWPLPGVEAPAALAPTTRGRIAAALDSPLLARGFAGALVVAAGTCARADGFELVPYVPRATPELFARHADRCFTPASSAKLLTAAAALDLLGGEQRFRTRVCATRTGPDGSVARLWLVGGGDPSLGYDGLRQLAGAVHAAGVRRVTGPVRGDGSRYADAYPEGWTVDDLLWYYAAPVSALSLERNQVDVTVHPAARAGEPARVSFAPANAYVQVSAKVTTSAPGTKAALRFARGADPRELVVRGSLPAGGGTRSEGLAVLDVERYAATVFVDCLRAAGIRVEGGAAAGEVPAEAAELAGLDSPPLRVLLQRLLKKSDNLYAELLLRELGRHSGGQGDVESGVQAVRDWLTRQGLEVDGVRLADGSGLSRYNLLTPRVLVGVLNAMALHREAPAWYAALPVAGVDGTLATRFKGTAAAGNLRAKTGYLATRTALAGYVTNRAGDLLVAATMFNAVTATTAEARALHDQVFVALADSER